MALPSAARSKSALAQLVGRFRHFSSSIEVVAVAVPDQGVTSVALEPELADCSSTVTIASGRHALQHFLGSVVGCSQHALAQAASDANVKLGAVSWRAESQLTEGSPQRLAAVTLKAELLERVPQAQLEALKQRTLQDSPLTAALMSGGCAVDLQLMPPVWLFKSSMGDHSLTELLHLR